MKKFIGKTQEEALNNAAAELNVPVENIYVDSVVENKGLFGRIKNVEVTCYTDAMVIEFVLDYLRSVIEKMGIKVDMVPSFTDGLIRVKLSTDHNSILIGKDGETLQALNEICRCAANATFKKRIRILLDVNEYKHDKYSKLVSIAKREAIKVSKTKITAELSPMSADERRVVHNALISFKHVKTISVGEGKDRHVTIQYVD
ncbi:MAG: KH domain-containing protein [Erysipelotrichaceae bacterium]|nr:KH domain-containing protein [Erysipelotrichaceae bacterium]